MNSMELSNYLEKIRYGRKMTQEEFLHGIISMRQYQRYRSGEGEIPYHKLEKFAEKLGIPTRKLMAGFEEEKNKQARLINELYNAVANRDKDKISTLKREVVRDFIIEQDSRTLYDHALIVDNYLSFQLSPQDAKSMNAQLIDYPDIMKREYFTDIEVLVMSSLLNLSEGAEQRKLLDRLTLIFEAENIISDVHDNIYMLILHSLCRMHGKLKRFSQVIKLCDMAIERGMRKRLFYLFDYFFYYKALAYYRLEDIRNFEYYMFKLYNVLQMEGNAKKITKFTDWVEKDFGIVYHTFIMKYMKKEIM